MPVLTIFGLAMLFLGWNAPNHYPPWTSFHLEWFAAAGIVPIALAVALPMRRTDARLATARLPLSMAAWGWLTAAALPVVQWIFGMIGFRADAILGAMYLGGAAVAMAIGQAWSARSGRDRVLQALWTTVVFAGIAAWGLALMQALVIDAPGWWAMELIDHRPFANLAQPNHFGLLMVWSLIALMGLSELRAVSHPTAGVLAASAFGSGVLLSDSRAAILALMAVALMAWWRAPTITAGPGRRGIGLGLVVFVVVYAIPWHFLFGTTVVDNAHGITDVGARSAIWRHALVAIAERPWLGWGFNQGVLALSTVADRVEPSRNTVYAHNVVLDGMLWFGVPITLALGAAFAAMLRKMLSSPIAPCVLVAALWLVLLVQSFFEFPYAYAYFLLPAALFTGAVQAPPSLRQIATHWRLGWTATMLTAVLVAALGVLITEYARIEEDFRHARFARANFVGVTARSYLDNPLLLDHLALLNASAGFRIAEGMPPTQIDQLQQLARRFNIPSVRMDYAQALALNGRRDEARAELRVMKALNPPVTFRAIESRWQQWLDQRALAPEPTFN